ncbi:MAG: FemAB family XrtA/PEP-CTERM system-associated protein [Vicinamibacterales bacterium]
MLYTADAIASDTVVEMTRDLSARDWDAFVDAHPDATGAHVHGWRGIFEDVLGHRCEYLASRRGGAVTGVLPLVKFRSRLFGRFVVSLPFLNNGGLLTTDDDSARALIEAARGIGNAFGAAHIELRHRDRQMPDLPSRDHKVGMLLPLTGNGEAMWNALDRKVRNQVRKAQKSELEAISGGEALLDEFYAVFARNMRDLGTPVLSKRFFGEVLRRFPQRACVFVVRHKGQPVAASLPIVHRGTFEVPWASSLKQFRQLCPNMLLYWTMIEAAAARGCTVFDFGRSTPDAGTYHFKLQWGAVPRPLHWEYALLSGRSIPDQGPSNPRFKAAIAAWTKLPLWMTVAFGPSIVRNIPG